MSDPIALDEGEQIMTVPEIVKPVHIQFARFISAILSPIAISLPLVLLVAFYRTTDEFMALWYSCVTLFFLSIGPMFYILIGVRLGKFTDIDVSQRSQRIGPFLFGIASTLIGLFTLLLTHGPKNLTTLLLVTAISGVIMMITTLWWKISIHSSSLAAALTLLTALYGNVILPAFSLVVLVSWSRVVLRRHTIAQVIAGSVVSIVLTAGLLAIRGM